jgi:hypothetical protein
MLQNSKIGPLASAQFPGQKCPGGTEFHEFASGGYTAASPAGTPGAEIDSYGVSKDCVGSRGGGGGIVLDVEMFG